jgi:nitric oxide reductase NorD protein
MSNESRQNFLNLIRIRKDLDRYTGGALARHANVDDVVARVAALAPAEQASLYDWAELLARANNELAAHFVVRAPTAFARMERGGVQDWLDHAMMLFDSRGLGVAIEVIENVDAFADDHAGRHVRCAFDDASLFLRHYVRGLGGRELRIASDPATYTDTEALYLPETLEVFAAAEQNFTLYKLTAVHLWAQTWYGTWRVPVVERLLREIDVDARLPIFNRLECLRLDACLARDLPGLARELGAYGDADTEAGALWDGWRARAAVLAAPEATADDSLRLVERFMDEPLPPLKRYQGEMFAGKVQAALSARVEREKEAFQRAMQELRDGDTGAQTGDDAGGRQLVEVDADGDESERGTEAGFQVKLDGQLSSLPDHLKELVGSILQDFGEIPDEHLEPLELGDYQDELLPQAADTEAEGDADANGTGTYTYREWDCARCANSACRRPTPASSTTPWPSTAAC